MGHREARIRRTLLGMVAAVAAFSLLAAMAPARVDAAIAVRAWHGNSCVAGWGPKGKVAKVEWRAGNGSLKAKGKVKVNKKGKWTLCSKKGKTVQTNDRIKVTVASKTRKAKVPRLAMILDREDDVISGVAPTNRKSIVQVWCVKDGFTKWCGYKEVTPKADGSFSFKAGAISGYVPDLRGGDRVQIFTLRTKKKPHLFGRDQYVPYVAVELGSATVNGAATPGASVTVNDWGTPNASWTGIASGKTKVNSSVYEGKVKVTGLYRGTLRDGGGSAAPVYAAHRIDVPGITWGPGWTALAINVNPVDKAGDVVSGSCGSKRRITVSATSADGSRTVRKTSLTQSDGAYSKDFTGKVDIKAGSVVKVTCYENSGDRTTQRVVVK